MKKSGIIATVVVLVLIVLGVVYWNTRPTGPTSPEAGEGTIKSPTEGQANTRSGESPIHDQESPGSPPPSGENKPSDNAGQSKTQAKTETTATASAQSYCRQAADQQASDTDSAALAKQGGLVAIFQREAALDDAYGCADYYLDHGGKVNTADPRADSKHLTPLLFAIQRNDPKMVHFMLDHGANPSQSGGPDDIKPYGYAVYLAMHNRSTNYNQVIDILNTAVGK